MNALTIARHELRRLFVSPLAWTVLAVTQLLLGLLFAMSLADLMLNPERIDDYAGVTEVIGTGLFRFAALILLLVIPLIAMRLFAEERKTGSLELLLASPISPTALVAGKFLGVLGFLTVMLALIALMPLSLWLGTPLDIGMLAAGLLGLWLTMAAFAAAGTFVSSLTREPALAAVGSFGLLLGIWLLHAVSFFDWQPIVLGVTLPLGDAARDLSLIGHYDNLLFGIFDSGDIFYYVVFCGLFLALAVQRLDLERHRLPAHVLRTTVTVALAGLLLWVSGEYRWQADWTHGNRNTLTPASQRVLDAMPDEIAFTAYVAPGPERQNVRDAVDRYRRYHAGVTLEFADPAEHPRKMREYGKSGDGRLVEIAYRGRTQAPDGLAEPRVTNALQRLSAIGDQWIVFLTGHGERDVEDDGQAGYSELRTELDRQGLRVRTLNLVRSPQVPANTAVLVIAAPRQNLLPGEIDRIRDHLAGGGNLLWLDDPDTGGGLPDLARELGVAWQEGTVIYPHYRELGIRHPAVALAIDYPRHPVTEYLDGLTLFPLAGGVTATGDGGWRATPLIRTPEHAWLEAGDLNAETVTYQAEAGDTLGPVTVGLALSRPAPPETGAPGEGAEAASRRQRAVVLADSDFLTNANIDILSNRALGAGLFQWLAYRDRQIAVQVPQAPDATLHLAPWQGRGIWLAFVIVLPLSLAAVGLGRRWLRRRR